MECAVQLNPTLHSIFNHAVDDPGDALQSFFGEYLWLSIGQNGLSLRLTIRSLSITETLA